MSGEVTFSHFTLSLIHSALQCGDVDDTKADKLLINCTNAAGGANTDEPALILILVLMLMLTNC